MELIADLDLGAGLRLRTLTPRDLDLVVQATRAESGRALWGPYPAGPYTRHDASAALDAWDPEAGGQVSFGMLEHGQLLGALGLMPGGPDGLGSADGSDGPGRADGGDTPDSADNADSPDTVELAYWVRPESRRQGLALRGINALTSWAHRDAGLARIWLEIDPGNAPSLRLAERAGYRFEERIADHCRTWTASDLEHDTWHDCLIWVHAVPATTSLVD